VTTNFSNSFAKAAAVDIYAGLKSLRDRYAHFIRAKYPSIPRRVSATT